MGWEISWQLFKCKDLRDSYKGCIVMFRWLDRASTKYFEYIVVSTYQKWPKNTTEDLTTGSWVHRAHWCVWVTKASPSGSVTQQLLYHKLLRKLKLAMTEKCQDTRYLTACCIWGCRHVRVHKLTTVHCWKHSQWVITWERDACRCSVKL